MGEVMLYLCAFGDRSVNIKYANNCVWGKSCFIYVLLVIEVCI